MDNVSETQAAAFMSACVELPAWAAFPPAVVSGGVARVAATKSGLTRVKGTSVPVVSRTHVQQSIRKPYNFTTRIYALGGGAWGPHPAREPEPV